MSDELEQVPAVAGAPMIGRFGQWLPGIRFHADVGTGTGAGDGGGAAAAADGAGAAGSDAALAGGAGAGTAADAGTDPAAAAAASVAPAPPAAAAPVWEDPAFLDLVDTRAEQLFHAQMAPLVPLFEQLLGSGDGAAAAAAAPGELNPWDPTFGGNLDARFQSLEQRLGGMIEQLVGGLAQREQQATIAEGEERLKDMLASDISSNGEFPRAIDPQTGQPATESKAEKLVMPLARMLFPEIKGRFGENPRSAELAITRAAGIVREIVAEARASAATEQSNRLATLAGANGDIPAAGAAVQTVGERQLKSWDDFSSDTSRHAALIRGDR